MQETLRHCNQGNGSSGCFRAFDPESFVDARAAAGFGSFDESVQVTTRRSSSGVVAASQQSEILVSSLSANGSASSESNSRSRVAFPESYPLVQVHEVTSAVSTFSVTFDLTQSCSYTLVGSVSAGGSFVNASTAAVVALTQAGGDVERVQVDCTPGPSANCNEGQSYSLAGTLAAGTYTLVASADGVAAPAYFGLGGFLTGALGNAGFDFDLTLTAAP